MKKLVLFLCLSISLAAEAQKQKTEAYIGTYKEIAIAEMMRTGVPAAITLAQGILESQSGESNLVKNSNNHFGIKCKTDWTGDKTYHDDDARGECFRVYPNPEESYKDHSEFLKTRPHYAFLFKLDPTDYEGWAKGLKKAGYATNPAYPQRLMKLINEYNLQQYSLEAIARLKNAPAGNQNTATALAASLPENETKENKFIQAKAVMEPLKEEPTAETLASADPKRTPAYPGGVFNINHTKVIYAKGGTSLMLLANTYDLPLGKLLEYNDLDEMDVLDTDRLIFIERKQKKGAADFHTVAAGETLHDISQVQGIRLENLLTYNNLKKGASVLTGDKVYLRTPVQSAAGKPAKNTRKTTGR